MRQHCAASDVPLAKDRALLCKKPQKSASIPLGGTLHSGLRNAGLRGAEREEWKNIGGQLMPAKALLQLIRSIRSGKIGSWDAVHEFYHQKSKSYSDDKLRHAFASLLEVMKISPSKFTRKLFGHLLDEAVLTKEWMVKGIYESRAKDYNSPFRQMLYDTQVEMDKVIGKLKDNSFILQQQQELAQFKLRVRAIKAQLTPQFSTQLP